MFKNIYVMFYSDGHPIEKMCKKVYLDRADTNNIIGQVNLMIPNKDDIVKYKKRTFKVSSVMRHFDEDGCLTIHVYLQKMSI